LENGLDDRARPETRARIIDGFKKSGLRIKEEEVFPNE
jgi:hypothetical protein